MNKRRIWGRGQEAQGPEGTRQREHGGPRMSRTPLTTYSALRRIDRNMSFLFREFRRDVARLLIRMASYVWVAE